MRKTAGKLNLGMCVIALAITNALIFSSVVAIHANAPYAVYADGTRTNVAYTITAGDKQTVLVKDAKTAEKAARKVVQEYIPDSLNMQKISTDKSMKIEKADIKKQKEKILTEDEAVDAILDKNASQRPYFSVTVEGTVSDIETVKPKTVEKETDRLFEGDVKTLQDGEAGTQEVIKDQVVVNGELKQSEVSDTVVLEEAEDKVVEVGTKDKDDLITIEKDKPYDGEIAGMGDGETIAEFAQQFVGNPYQYGGTSLTEGADCSGFVYAVYREFGLDIPRVGAENVGRRVSYDEAKPGDIIKYPGHYAMYIGDDKIVHAYCKKYGICITSAHAPGTIQSVTRIVEK